MNVYDEFLDSISSHANPNQNLSPCLLALWWLKKGDWEKAHNIAQDMGNTNGDWIHAHLHRVEGDLGNAAYWYRRAGKPVKQKENLDKEWEELVKQFLS